MNLFTLQIQTGKEADFIKASETLSAAEGGVLKGHLFFPQKNMDIRKKGVSITKSYPLFPGYLFYRTDEITPEEIRFLRTLPGFYRFLPETKHIRPLSGEDRELLVHFMSFGEVLEKSQVYFDENNHIRVLRGPLMGLEGEIVKVDRRKKRVKVQLSLYKKGFLIDLSYDILEKID